MAQLVNAAARVVQDRPALVPWVVFVAASLPAMAGALGSAGVAMLAPIALRLASRYEIDRRLIGLMVVHGAAAGNFSPLNVLGAIVHHAVTRSGLEVSTSALFFANLAYKVVLAMIIAVVFRRRRPRDVTLEVATTMAVASPAVTTDGRHSGSSPRGKVLVDPPDERANARFDTQIPLADRTAGGRDKTSRGAAASSQ